MYNCLVRWYTVVDEMSVDEMTVDVRRRNVRRRIVVESMDRPTKSLSRLFE